MDDKQKQKEKKSVYAPSATLSPLQSSHFHCTPPISYPSLAVTPGPIGAQPPILSQMSEIRKALDLMKRVESFGNSGTRRLALELGTLDLERADKGVARRMNTGTDMADGA